MMDRNWLIRTTQFQILGPISKEKILEFYKKGALGPDDEICSGNGYWFSIKEKDLVEKYLTGDIPQSFNPISEAPTVVALKASMGDQTSSLNRAHPSKTTSPDQTLVLSTSILIDQNGLSSQSDATAVVSLKDLNASKESEKVPTKSDLEYPDIVVPKKDDLEYPDLAAPKKEDLEYPSLTLDLDTPTPTKSVGGSSVKDQTAMKYNIPSAESLQAESSDPVHLPKDDDLAYPDMSSSSKRDFKLDIKNDSGLTLELEERKPTVNEEATKTQFMTTSPGSAKAVLVNNDIPAKKSEEPVAKVHVKPQEERKLLSERKKTVNKEVQPSKKAQQIRQNEEKPVAPNLGKRNDTYFFFIIVLLILIILGVLFYYQEILNKPLPV